MKHDFRKYLDSEKLTMCIKCGCYFDGFIYNHPATGRTNIEPDCPPKDFLLPVVDPAQIINDLEINKLTGKYLGVIEWSIHAKVPTMNIFHQWYKGPIATFHHATVINFKDGIQWNIIDLHDLIELHQLWQHQLLPGQLASISTIVE